MTRTEICLSEQLETSASASEIIQGDKTYQTLSQDAYEYMKTDVKDIFPDEFNILNFF